LWESSDDIRVEGSERLVDVVTGDELSEAEHLKSPTVVKVDVEGHEYAVLRGLQHSLSRVDCRLLCCEIHPTLLPPGIAVENVLQQIQALDFRKQDHVARGSQIHVIAYRRGDVWLD